MVKRTGLRPELSADLVARLYHGARYRFGRSIETLLNAIETALGSGASCLTNDHFARVWAMQEGCAPGENVLLVDGWAGITPDPVADQLPVRQRGRRK